MAAFLAKIKRRKVVKVTAVYAVVAWLLVQIVATVEGPQRARFSPNRLSAACRECAGTIIATSDNDVNGSAALSRDGRWSAYAAGTEGNEQIYVRPFPEVYSGGPCLVSTDGGREPLWSPRGDEIFYRRGDDVMAASVSFSGSAFRSENPDRLFSASSYIGSDSLYLSGWIQRSWDIMTDGRFLMIRGSSSMPPAEDLSLVVVDNWFDEVRRRSPSM